MDRLRQTAPGNPRPTGLQNAYYGPVMWIAILLTGWYAMAEWRSLPSLISSAMAALT
jgi:hypothetical protein